MMTIETGSSERVVICDFADCCLRAVTERDGLELCEICAIAFDAMEGIDTMRSATAPKTSEPTVFCVCTNCDDARKALPAEPQPLVHQCDDCDAIATVQRGLLDLCELHDTYKTAAHLLSEDDLQILSQSPEAIIAQAARSEIARRAPVDDGCISQEEAIIDQRCGEIARQLLGFDSRVMNGPELRTVTPAALHAALLLAYRAGLKDR